jgi:hypothetical protein
MFETALHIYMIACTVIVTVVILGLVFVAVAFRDEMRERHRESADRMRRGLY